MTEWQEFGLTTKIVDGFFKFLLTTAVDPQNQAISKLPQKKEEVEIMRARLVRIESTDVSPEEVGIILEDLTLLSQSINTMYEESRELWLHERVPQ